MLSLPVVSVKLGIRLSFWERQVSKKESAFIQQQCPQAISLVGHTSVADIACLGVRAVCAVGNDTGPMHLLVSVGCRSVVVYSSASSPALCGQRGPAVAVLQQSNISDITSEAVVRALKTLGCDVSIGAGTVKPVSQGIVLQG